MDDKYLSLWEESISEAKHTNDEHKTERSHVFNYLNDHAYQPTEYSHRFQEEERPKPDKDGCHCLNSPKRDWIFDVKVLVFNSNNVNEDQNRH